MQRNIVETVLGAAVLLVAGGFMAFFMKTADIGATEGGYALTARFSSVDGLTTGAPVRISGVKVGQVTDFSLDPTSYSAVVTINVDSTIKLPIDSSAVIASAGMLDGKFMTLQPGGDEEMLRPGDRIEYTQATASLEQLLGQVIFSLTKGKDEDKKTEEPAAP